MFGSHKKLVRSAAIAVVAVVPMLLSMAPAFAYSGDTTTPTLPGTCDYLETRTWLGTTDTFNAASSSWLWNSCPVNAYLISDINTIQVNGIAVSLGNTGGSVSSTGTSATYECDRYYAWECDNNIYNLTTNPFYWNIVSNDTTKVIIWYNTSPHYNSAQATKWT